MKIRTPFSPANRFKKVIRNKSESGATSMPESNTLLISSDFAAQVVVIRLCHQNEVFYGYLKLTIHIRVHSEFFYYIDATYNLCIRK